jgi:cytidine deaminase
MDPSTRVHARAATIDGRPGLAHSRTMKVSRKLKVVDQNEPALIEAAAKAADSAYAPYSRFTVGAAVRTKTGGIYVGCNVENISYPVGVCAERNAIAAAVSAEGRGVQIASMAVVARNNGKEAPCSPCGACRQALREFGKDIAVYYRWPALEFKRSSAAELLPDTFGFDKSPEARR